MNTNKRLFNLGFVALNILVLFSFCNLAVFYSFFNHLNSLGLSGNFSGMLIGLFSVSALVFRPVISPFLGPHNAIRNIGLGLAMVALSLNLYAWADSLPALICLRIFHGLAYVLLMSSAVTLLMEFMPPEKSCQGFSIISIMTLLPYAVIPLAMETLFTSVSAVRCYGYTSFFILPCAFLLIPLSKRLSHDRGKPEAPEHELVSARGLSANLRQPGVSLVLLVNGTVFAGHALVFFFLKTFVRDFGFGDPGIFFTISAFAMIIIRLGFGSLFDAFDKALLSLFSIGVFVVSLVLLSMVGSVLGFYFAAALYGAGMGAASPLLNGLMFLISEPRYRGLNTNLMLEMVDAGFFLGPLMGGLAVAQGLDQAWILICTAALIFMVSFFLLPLVKKNKNYTG